jgi:hypothetical protein
MADSGKKRKRPTDSSVKASRKVVAQPVAQIKDVTVSLVIENDEWAPVVGMFTQLPKKSSDDQA